MNQDRYTDRVEIGKVNGVTSYLVRDTQLDRDVELRVWTPTPTDGADADVAFLEQAMLRARLAHPGIPAILDSGDWPGGGHYYTLQLARGTALSTHLKNPPRKWPAPPLRIVAEACRAIAHAHERGVVHNRVSGENIIVAAGGAVYVDGWEDARPVAAVDNNGETHGADPRTDVHALGTLLGIAQQHDKVRDPAPLRALVQRAVAMDPAARPKDARALLAGLEGNLALDVPAGPRKQRKPRRHFVVAGLTVLLSIVALAAAAALWPQTRDRIPWMGSFVDAYLGERQPDSALARWFGGEQQEDTSALSDYTARILQADHAVGVRSFKRAHAALAQTAPDQRHWEWGYLAQRTNLDSFTFDPEIGMVFALAFSPDGNWLAVGGSNRRIQLYRWPQGEFVGDLDGHGGRVLQVQFTPDSNTLVTASDDNNIIVWDVESRQARQTYSDHSNRIWAVQQLPNNVIASTSWDPNITLWDMRTGENVGRIAAPEGIWTLALAPDHRRLYAGAYDGTFAIYDLENRWPIHVQNDPANFITHLEVRSDGREIAAAYFDPLIRLLDPDGQVLHELHGHQDVIFDVDYSHDNEHLISAGRDGTARIWDLETHDQIAVLEGHDSEVNTVALDPGGDWLLTASDDGTIKGWRARPWLSGWTPHLSIQKSEILVDLRSPVALASNGRWAAAGMASGDILVWVPRGRRVRHRILPAMKERVTALALEPTQGLVAAGGDDGALVLWSSRSAEVVRQFTAQDAGITALTFSPDGRTLYVGGHDQQVRFLDLDTGEPGAMGNHSDSITTIAVSADGEFVASGSLDDTIRIWRNRRIHSVLRAHKSTVSALAFSPTGRYLASGGADHQIYVWDTRTESEEPLLLGTHNSQVNALTFSPDGRRLFSGGHDGTVRVWDIDSQQELLVLDDLDGWIHDLVFLNDQRALLAINRDGTRAVWRAFPWDMQAYPGNSRDALASRFEAYKRLQRDAQLAQQTAPIPFSTNGD